MASIVFICARLIAILLKIVSKLKNRELLLLGGKVSFSNPYYNLIQNIDCN